MHSHHRLGKSNQDSIYFQAWKNIIPLTDTSISTRYLKTAKHQVRHTVNRYRTGCLYNNKLAFRNRQVPSPACPLCGETDGGNHIAGGCLAEDMRRMYQAAHNALGRIITRAVAKGSMGGNIIQADVGSAAMCARDGAPDPGQRRLSASNIPLPPNATPSQMQAHKELENMSIPDATLILPDPRPNHLPSILLIDLKTCNDTKPAHQLQHCFAQHAQLTNKLREVGYTDVRTIPILVGHSGTIYLQHTLAALETLGIDRARAEKCAGKLHDTACSWLDSIYRTRQRLVRGQDSKFHKTQGLGPSETAKRYRPP